MSECAAGGDGVPDQSGDDRAAVECHRVRPGDGIAALHRRSAHRSRSGLGPSFSMPVRSTSIRRRDGLWRSSGYQQLVESVSRRGVQGTVTGDFRALPPSAASPLAGSAARKSPVPTLHAPSWTTGCTPLNSVSRPLLGYFLVDAAEAR